MATRRIKPRLDITVDRDVMEWVGAESEAQHLKPSQFVNRLLWAAKNREDQAVRTSVVQNVNGSRNHVGAHVKVSAKKGRVTT